MSFLGLLKTFRQDDRIGAQRRKTALSSPKGERRESINKIHRIDGMKR
jgi:hypothetical protein